TDSEALDLLMRVAKVPRTAITDEAREVLERCGNVPLAITMVGSLVRGIPDPWPGLLERMRRSAVEAIASSIPGYPHQTLVAALHVSVSALDDEEQRRYAELATLLGVPTFPRVVITRLWEIAGWTELQADVLLRKLVDRSLAFWDSSTDSFWLHDLQS